MTCQQQQKYIGNVKIIGKTSALVMNGDEISGDEQPKSNARRTKEDNIKQIVLNYKKSNISDHLLGLANNMGEVKIRK
jgi:hypothetical protein